MLSFAKTCEKHSEYAFMYITSIIFLLCYRDNCESQIIPLKKSLNIKNLVEE